MKRKAKVSLLSLMLLVLAGTATPVSAQSRDKAKEAELIQLLKNESTPGPERAMACKLLALHGGPDCVALLGPMLADEKFASWARIALEAIPGPEAAAVLRDASQNLNGKLLVGVLNSIGVRRDADSLDMLNKRLADPSSEVAGAAALALGRIGGDAAEAALRSALTNSNAELRSAAAEGCILCAERRLASGDAIKPSRCTTKFANPKYPSLDLLKPRAAQYWRVPATDCHCCWNNSRAMTSPCNAWR